jgi:undecaprenyl diphosphate synthase
MFAFSTENWNRSPQEVRSVFRVMEQTAHDFYGNACREQIRIRVLGNLNDKRIPASLVKALERLQEGILATSSFTDSAQSTRRFTLNLAINYGGRQDLIQAAQQLARQVQHGTLQPDDITEDHLTSTLSTRHLPDPDLIIRTSGEYRLSNFLLWNAAYAELYFTDCLWPDFDREELEAALEWYAERQRRFGGRNVDQENDELGRRLG